MNLTIPTAISSGDNVVDSEMTVLSESQASVPFNASNWTAGTVVAVNCRSFITLNDGTLLGCGGMYAVVSSLTSPNPIASSQSVLVHLADSPNLHGTYPPLITQGAKEVLSSSTVLAERHLILHNHLKSGVDEYLIGPPSVLCCFPKKGGRPYPVTIGVRYIWQTKQGSVEIASGTFYSQGIETEADDIVVLTVFALTEGTNAIYVRHYYYS